MSDTPETAAPVVAPQQTEGLAPNVAEKELAEARKEAAKYRTELRRLEADREAREREAAEKQGEYQSLYEREKQRAADLETRAQRVEALETTLTGLVKELARDLPEDLRSLMPDAPAEVQLEWLGKARKAAAKLTEARTPGTPAGPRGNGSVGGAADQTATERERLRQSSRYNPL